MAILKDNEIEFQLAVYSERNACVLQFLDIIPKEYWAIEEPEDNMGICGFTADTLREPEVLIYLHVPADKEKEFMRSLSDVAEALHPDMGGFVLVKVVPRKGFSREKVITLVEPIQAKDLQEHMKWCDLSCWQEYQVNFKNVQAHPDAIKLICPDCIHNPKAYHHWYADPDPNNEFTEHVCPICCKPGIKADTK